MRSEQTLFGTINSFEILTSVPAPEHRCGEDYWLLLSTRLVSSQGEYVIIVELTVLIFAGRAPEHYLRRIIDKNFRYHYFYSNHAIFQQSKPASLKTFQSHSVPWKEKSASKNLRAVQVYYMFTWYCKILTASFYA